MSGVLTRAAREELELRLQYAFDDPALLTQALTHRSCGTPHNERLEFIGDAILGQVTAVRLYALFPQEGEGRLTQMRSTLVCERALLIVGRRLRLDRCLRCGPEGTGVPKPSMVADAVEAVIGAMFVDSGGDYAAVSRIVLAWLAPEIAGISPQASFKDPKSELQERWQEREHLVPTYRVVSVTGRDNEPHFEVEVCVGAHVRARGKGSSKRRAEQAAAAAALAEPDGTP